MHRPVTPLPPAGTGLIWRSPNPQDADALVGHAKRVDRVERLDYVDGPSFFGWLMTQHDFDPETDWLVGIDTAGEVAVEAGAWTQVTDSGSRAYLWFGALRGDAPDGAANAPMGSPTIKIRPLRHDRHR